MAKINDLAHKANIPPPVIGTCFVAEDESGVIGYVNGGVVGFIESIVSDNSIATLRMFSVMEGSLMTAVSSPIFASVVNAEAGELLKRAGFKKQHNEFYMKKG